MNALDVLVLLVAGFAAYSGYHRGLLLMFVTYLGLGAGLVVGARLAPPVAAHVTDPSVRAGIAIGALLVFGGLGDGLGWFLGNRVRARARQVRAIGGADAAGGSILGVAGVLLVTWFLALNLVGGPVPRIAREIRGSLTVRTLDALLPQPPPLVGELRRLLNTLGFPDVFAGLPPAPAGPVRPPSGATVRRALDAARASTVEVTGDACGVALEGSGFVASLGYVVTNAHVVAGERATSVHDGGGTLPAEVVLFDPRTDVAVLRVGGLAADPLPLDASAVARGTQGAVLGFPEGGPLTADPAAVLRPIVAVGRDIYGHGTVRRDVYELQALVRPGNSGGPFALPDGAVAGVVFAASTTDPRVGYAIVASEVAPLLREARASRAAASTGACIG